MHAVAVWVLSFYRIFYPHFSRVCVCVSLVCVSCVCVRAWWLFLRAGVHGAGQQDAAS